MAQLAGGVVGAIIGSFVGMPQLGFMVGSMVGGFIDNASRVVKEEGPRISDLNVSSSAYGNPKPILYGTMRVPAQIIWTSGIKETKIVKKKRAGKGGGPTVKTTTYQYSANLACGLCEGPIDGIVRIWMDSKLVYDRDGTGVLSDNRFVLRVYNGTENQFPDGMITSYLLPGASPAYRGLAYIVLEGLELEPFGNRIPSITVETSVSVQVVNYLERFNPQTAISGTLWHSDYDVIRRQYIYLTNLNGGTFYAYDEDGNLLRQVQLNTKYNPGFGVVHNTFLVVDGEDYYFLISETVGFNYHFRVARYNPDTSTIIAISPTPVFILGPGGILNFGGFQTTFNELGEKIIYISFEKYSVDITSTKLVNSESLTEVSGIFPTPLWGGVVGAYSFVPGMFDVEQARYRGYGISYNGSFGFGTNGDLYICEYDIAPIITSRPYNTITESMIVNALNATDGGSRTNVNTFLLGTVYDALDDTLILYTSGNAQPVYIFKYHFATNSFIWAREVNYNTFPHTRFNRQISRSDISQGNFGVPDTQGFVVNTRTGEVEFYSSGVSPTNYKHIGFIWDSTSYAGVGFYSNPISGSTTHIPNKVFFNRATTGTVTLKSIVDDLCRRGGLNIATQVDTTSLASIPVKGYIINRPTSAQAALEQLSSAFFVKSVESDGKIKFYLRGSGSSVETIPQQWLGPINENDSYWKETRQQELDLPKKITVTYINPEDDYQQGAQHEQRITNPFPSSWGKSEISIEMPMVLYPTEAKTMANNILYSTWAERVNYETILPWRYSYLDPTDIVTVSMDSGDTYQVRITATTLGNNNHVETSLVSQDTSVFVPPTGINGSTSLGFVPQTLLNPTVSRISFFDIPFLEEIDYDPSGYVVYYGAAPYSRGWTGGQLTMSTDNGVFYSYVDDIFQPTINGAAVDALGTVFSSHYFDVTNSVTVFLTDGEFELDSLSDERFLAGENVALIGKELIYFKNATLNLDGSYTLSYLLRGRRGTEWAIGTHTPGEKVHIFEDNNFIRKTMSPSIIGQTNLHRLTTFGRYESEMPIVPFEFTGMSERAFSPESIRKAISGADLNISWNRRNRYNGTMRDGSDIPQIEGAQNYSVYILSSPYDPVTENTQPPTSYVRLYSGLTSQTVNYNSTDRTADGFNMNADILHLVIFQYNSFGAGIPGFASLPP